MTLYTTHCPRCRVLEAALASKGAAYDTCDDAQKMIELGFTEAPVLEVGDRRLSYAEAMKYVMEEL